MEDLTYCSLFHVPREQITVADQQGIFTLFPPYAGKRAASINEPAVFQ